MPWSSMAGFGATSCKQRLPSKEGEAAASTVKFTLLSPDGPCLAYHVGCVIARKLYVHGGINKSGSASPLSGLHCYEFESNTWHELSSPDSPALSHHAAVVYDDRYLVLVGGWSGKKRTCDVHIYDTQTNQWSNPRTDGFPIGAGLSSHTATLLRDRRILVIGREGSLRTQRRSASEFILSGDPRSGSSGVFRYVEHSTSIASRSGHTACQIGSMVYVIGGRSDNVLELVSAADAASGASYTTAARLEELATCLLERQGHRRLTMKGLKNHAALAGTAMVFVHGGWTFDGKTRDPVGEMFALVVKPVCNWVSLGGSDVNRAGHICVGAPNPYGLTIHGGEGKKGTIHSSLYKIEVT